MKLNIIALVGEHFNVTNKNNYSWALFKKIGTLNPTFTPVLVDRENNKYYDIEGNVTDFIKTKKKFSNENHPGIRLSLKMIQKFPKKCRPDEIAYFKK